MNTSITEITVSHNIAENRFEVDLGEEKAVLIYLIKAGLFIMLHTEVPPPFEGRGIAGKMAAAALEFAKKEGYKVRSYCSYTTLYIERHPEYGELLG
jgi:predicted GNAT family acetyltransferase